MKYNYHSCSLFVDFDFIVDWLVLVFHHTLVFHEYLKLYIVRNKLSSSPPHPRLCQPDFRLVLQTRRIILIQPERRRALVHAVHTSQPVPIVLFRELVRVDLGIVIGKWAPIWSGGAVTRLRFPHVSPIGVPRIHVLDGVETVKHTWKKTVLSGPEADIISPLQLKVLSEPTGTLKYLQNHLNALILLDSPGPPGSSASSPPHSLLIIRLVGPKIAP